jgi:hypothetical protein
MERSLQYASLDPSGAFSPSRRSIRVSMSPPAQHFLYFFALPHGHGSLRAGGIADVITWDEM